MTTGEIVGGAAVPHAPQFFTLPDSEDHDQVERIRQTMGEIGTELRDLNPDGVVIIANDHLQNFLLHCVPAFTVHRGPRVSGSFHGHDFSWSVSSDMSTDLVKSMQEQHLDPAVSLNAPIGYEFGIPLTFLGFPSETPLIPIYINSYMPPQPSADRCYEIGRAIKHAAVSLGRRLVVIASGGLSHYPGTSLYAHPDLQTDEYLLDRMQDGDLRVLLEPGDEGLDRTGNVEARSWLVLAGALGQRVPDTVSLEPSWHHNYAILGWTHQESAMDKHNTEELHYPVPRPEQLALYEALYELRMNRESCHKYLANASAYADGFNLDSKEREALVSLDENALGTLGVHPLLSFLANLEVDLARKDSRKGD